jgi:hypothetical protein
VNNQHQLALAMRMYVDDESGRFPPRADVRRWPSQIHRNFHDLKLLVCPNDAANPATASGSDQYPADRAPRSYIYNGWNDFMEETLPKAEMDGYMAGTHPVSMRESQIPHPSDTVLTGEKITASPHYFMDLLEREQGNAIGNDLFQLDRSRHGGRNAQNSETGGSNYAVADGSVRYIKYGEILWPQNHWAVSDKARTTYAVDK